MPTKSAKDLLRYLAPFTEGSSVFLSQTTGSSTAGKIVVKMLKILIHILSHSSISL
jgi:hypothetical protein